MGINAISSTTAVDMSAAATASASTASSKASQTEAKKAGGPPPMPPAGGAKPAAAASTSSTTSAAKIYEAADTNKDGTVSFQEELMYSIQHPKDETEKQEQVSISQLQNGLKSYKQGQQTDGSTQGLSLLAV